MLRSDPFMLAVVLWAAPALAEFRCTSNVHYEWKKSGEENKEPSRVVWAQASGAGVSEEEARSKVTRVIEKMAEAADKECRRRHENLSGCIAARFSQNSGVLSTLSFSARKALEEAITADCKALQGSCGRAGSSEPACKDEAAKAGEEKPGEGKAPGGGEEKKGGEKKK